jgi:large subunit ribosomal protein L16
MMSPKRTKFRKAHKGRIHGLAKGNTVLNFGSYGLKALEPERITARQIESARRAITRAMKRAGRVWIRIFPDVARVHPGRIVFEIDGVSETLAREALALGAAKLPIKTKVVNRIGEA